MLEQTPVEGQSAERTMLEKVTLGLVGLSAIGFVMSLIGHFAGWTGFDDGGESSVAGSTFWMMYFLAGLGALVMGVVTLVHGSRAKLAGERRTGQLALAYVVIAVVLLIIVDALD